MKKTSINKNTNEQKMGGLEWEMRPGGMLVQKRNLESSLKTPSNPTIKISVKFGSNTHDFHINSRATFGELKKMLAGTTRIHPHNQKLIFKDKARESREFLDVSGVKDGSGIILINNQEVFTQEKPTFESRGNFTMDKAMKSVAEVTMEVDKLAAQVTTMESVICKGERVTEKELLTLIELFMSQLIKLDGIEADGDAKLKRKMQVKRIQKYVENLDRLKALNATRVRNGGLIVSQPQHHRKPILVVQQQRDQRNFPTRQIKLF